MIKRIINKISGKQSIPAKALLLDQDDEAKQLHRDARSMLYVANLFQKKAAEHDCVFSSFYVWPLKSGGFRIEWKVWEFAEFTIESATITGAFNKLAWMLQQRVAEIEEGKR